MPNDPAQDRYDPPNTRITDFDEVYWQDLEEQELFWLTTERSGDTNVVHRKMNNIQGVQLRTGDVVEMSKNTVVYTKI